jgi:hypothetical protein
MFRFVCTDEISRYPKFYTDQDFWSAQAILFTLTHGDVSAQILFVNKSE